MPGKVVTQSSSAPGPEAEQHSSTKQDTPSTPVGKRVSRAKSDNTRAKSDDTRTKSDDTRTKSDSKKAVRMKKSSKQVHRSDSGTSHGSSRQRTRTGHAQQLIEPSATALSRPTNLTSRVPSQSTDRFVPQRLSDDAITHINAVRGSQRTERSRPASREDSSDEAPAVQAVGAHDLRIFSTSSPDDEDLHRAIGDIQLEDDEEEEHTKKPSPRTVAYQDSLADACGMNTGKRILEFKPNPPQSIKPVDLRAQYNQPTKSVSGQLRRRIASAPEKVLDAPSIVDDYYLNLLDWSPGNQVAIALERAVYVWSADTGSVNSLFETSDDVYVTSVKWSGDGAYVAAGLDSGEIQIWDVEDGTKLRSMHGHQARVGVMAWNKHILSSGDRSGLIINHDVRVAEHNVAELSAHSHEVCGLQWRSDGQMLASGGNDNLVNIWDARSLNEPKHTKTNHHAAVKAVAWCPWQLNLLATGGGSNDRQIHFWNSTTGARLNSIDTGSQVTSIQWSPHYKELVSSGGFPNNALSVWTYPTLTKSIEIPGHEQRILCSSLSPDGQTLATAAADENLKFWKLFEKKAGAAQATSAKPRAITAPATQIR